MTVIKWKGNGMQTRGVSVPDRQVLVAPGVVLYVVRFCGIIRVHVLGVPALSATTTPTCKPRLVMEMVVFSLDDCISFF